jgi:lipopolysaccharide transport system permease protein
MVENLRELYRYRELLYMITYRDLKVRYKQSAMGLLWAILMPILIVTSGIMVRYLYSVAAHAQLQTADITGVAVKSLPWAFLVSSIRFGCNSLILGNRDLVTKIYFPKEIFPLAAVLSSFFDFSIASAALCIFLFSVHTGWSFHLLWVPFLIVALLILCSGVGLLVAAASLFFRDVRYLVEVLLTFGIFFTPVFYDAQMLGNTGKWLLLNPAAPILEGFAACVAHQQSPQWPWLAYSLLVGLAALLGGYIFFKRLEPAFAECI